MLEATTKIMFVTIRGCPSDLGYDLQAVTPLGSPIAWLFSQPMQGAENGFSLTGGVFNYTAKATFLDTMGETITIRFYFKGLDAFGSLVADVDIQGETPRFSGNGRGRGQRFNQARVQVYDYEEEYTRLRPGEIRLTLLEIDKIVCTSSAFLVGFIPMSFLCRSQSTRAFSHEGGTKVWNFDLEQYITYEEKTCSPYGANQPHPSTTTTKLVSAR